MKMHPFLVIGIVVVSAVGGYHFRSGFPASSAPDQDAETLAVDEPTAEPETPQPRRSLAAIEAENEIRRAVEEKEEALAQTPTDDQSPSLERPPVVIEKFSAAPFYNGLAPHGEWLQADDYGDVWQPQYAHGSDWRPYVDGGWAYTEAGWTWDSDEPGGDITCHYGRWVNLTECGWCWVPGYDWAPAWVSWRCSDEVIGWAPLPPCVPWRPAAGLGPWVDACGDLGPGSYCFVPIRHFAAANCRPVLCARAESAAHFCHTRNLTRLVCKPAADGRPCPVLDGPDVHRIAALCPKDLRHRRLQWVEASAPRTAKVANREVLPVRRFAFSAAAGASERSPKASRRLDHAAPASPWREAGDPQMVATARRQAFAEAHETFRGLPRLVPPVGTAKPAAPRRQREEAKVTQSPVIESVRGQPAPARPAREVGATPRGVAAVDQTVRRTQISEAARPAGKTSRGAERLVAQAAREREARETLLQQRAAEAQAAEHLREQEQQQQEQQIVQQQEQQQEQQRHALTTQREKDERQRQAGDQRAQRARNQAMVEQQQHQAEAERRATAEGQRQQAESRQQQETERRQQLEQARQQAMLQARQQQESQQREQIEQSRRQAEMQARQMAAEQRQRENEARQQQAEAQRRQADENQRRQQMQEAQERAHAARQQQVEQARQHQQAETGRQREQEAARQQGGHSQEKRGR